MSQYKTVSCCKGTTNNAHLQQNCAKVYFQVLFWCKWAALCDRTFEEGPAFLREVSSKVQQCRLMRGRSPHNWKYCSRTVVCSAFCERTFEVGEFAMRTRSVPSKVQPFHTPHFPQKVAILKIRFFIFFWPLPRDDPENTERTPWDRNLEKVRFVKIPAFTPYTLHHPSFGLFMPLLLPFPCYVKELPKLLKNIKFATHILQIS